MEIVTPIILLLLEVGGDSDGESEMLRPKFRSVQVLIKSLLSLLFETAAAREGDDEDEEKIIEGGWLLLLLSIEDEHDWLNNLTSSFTISFN